MDDRSFRTQNLKLSDFGSAHFYGVEGVAKTATPEYIPPENLLNKNEINMNQTSTDIWSLGVLLYKLCTYEMPFFDKDFNKI